MEMPDQNNLNRDIKESKYEVPKLQDLSDLNWCNRMNKYIKRQRVTEKWTEKELKRAILKGLNGNPTVIDAYENADLYLTEVVASIGQTLGENNSLTIIRSLSNKRL
eukprot:TRINITY_DN810_c0_g1_i6.p1 TRINITY_DN810_c0_g1~~TRINITY_DN810_c0_g1_i6.p1  ORF type:complete len:107 (+),score=9.51 TRINITY_DN810_c0_g1_i6:382-702(+)